MFAIRKEELGRVDLIHVAGRVDGFNAPQLDQALQQSLKQKRYRIVVDFSETDFMASAALRALLRARQASHEGRRHGDVRLAGLSPRLQEAVELVGFNTLFQIFPDGKTAIDSYKA
jgi:anti-sigma B factor antagonist